MNIDELIYAAVFADDNSKKQARAEIRRVAQEKGILPASIYTLYKAIGKGEVKGFTVPAINIKTLTYDVARILFQLMKQKNVGALIFEIAKSEIEYSFQRPDEFATAVLAAAIKEDYRGPVFIQADHYQFNKKKYASDADGEIQKMKDLVKESIGAAFYNIDIDASTLVDLEKESLDEQQKVNFEVTAQMSNYITQVKPHDVAMTVGGEIGHIGGKNSTVGDFNAFMSGYLGVVGENGLPAGSQGLTKVSVQTGTTHGGVMMPDGTMAEIKLDFNVLQDIGRVARETYGMAGAVQHGASTLPEELFSKFPQAGTLEIHLGTAFLNTFYDHIPAALRDEMYAWVKENLQGEKEEGWSDEQFMYRTRKKALGPFKEKLWRLSENEKKPILAGNRKQFALLIAKLNVENTKDLVRKYIQ